MNQSETIYKIKNLLKTIGCNDETIENIFSSNPKLSNRNYQDIEDLINKLYSLNFTNLETIFESNPYILDLDSFEIDEFIKNKEIEGLTKEEISDLIELYSDII